MISSLGVIGYWGPTLLTISTLIGLYIHNQSFIKYYILFQILNSAFNSILKLIIRQPRPNNQKHLYNFEKKTKLKVMSGQEFGMPSGHAQSSLYSVMCNYFLTDCNFTIFSIIISIITIIQRFKFRNHTLTQLFAGSLVGIFWFFVMLQTSKFFYNFNIY